LQPVVLTSLATFVSGIDFLEGLSATVSGTVFNDANSNGLQDAGETGIAGRTVYADQNHNGVLDVGDSSTITDVSGNYTLSVVTGNNVPIRLVDAAGTRQTSPAGGAYQYNLTTGQNITGASFGTVGADLTINVLSAPETAVTGGEKIRKPAIVSIANVGNFTVSGLVGFNLYFSTDTTLDAGDYEVGEQLGKKTLLKPGQSKTYRIHYTVPTNVPSGNYHLLAQVLSSVTDNNATNDVFAATPTTQVLQPFIDLGVEYPQYPNTPQLDIGPGNGTSVAVIVTNHSNVMYNGDVDFRVYESDLTTLGITEGSLGPAATVVGKLPHVHLRLKPSQTRVIGVSVPAGSLVKGVHYLITTITPVNSLGDQVPANDIAVGPFPSYIR
jgi:SdrD B-like protein